MRDDSVRTSLTRCEEALEQERQRVTKLEQEIAESRAKLDDEHARAEGWRQSDAVARDALAQTEARARECDDIKFLHKLALEREQRAYDRARRLEEALRELSNISRSECGACVEHQEIARAALASGQAENPPSLPETT